MKTLLSPLFVSLHPFHCTFSHFFLTLRLYMLFYIMCFTLTIPKEQLSYHDVCVALQYACYVIPTNCFLFVITLRIFPLTHLCSPRYFCFRKLGSSKSKYFADSLLTTGGAQKMRSTCTIKAASTWISSSVHTSFNQSSPGLSRCYSCPYS